MHDAGVTAEAGTLWIASATPTLTFV